MNYYEEFGIPRKATTLEIREAYKLAARLLHPDNQQDPQLKNMAECQMKRLSDVVAVLLNPRERTRYDEGLADCARRGQVAPLAPASQPQLLRTVLRHGFWVLLGAMTIITLMTTGMTGWFGLARTTDAPPLSAPAASASLPAAPVVARNQLAMGMTPPVRPAGNPSKFRDSRNPRPPWKRTVALEPVPLPGATALTPAAAPTAPPKEEERGVAPMQKTEPAEVAWGGGESRFLGEWLYAADGKERDPAGAYPARYVEFQLREENGILVGDYRSLHRIADKAISPEVAFRVRGQSPAGNTGKLSWESSGGAKGELELTLRSPNQLQLKWWTTQFGRQEALSSGMAVLMRLKTP